MGDAEDLQFVAVLHLDHQPITQQHVDAGRVDQLGIKRHDHRVLAAKVVDLVVGQDHPLVSKPAINLGVRPDRRTR